MSSTGPYDPGLQAERTLLAWRRTALALAIISAGIARYAGEQLGLVPALTLGLAGVVGAGWAYHRATGRYDRAHAHLVQADTLAGDGVAFAVATTSLLLVSLAALVFVLGTGLDLLS